MELKFTPRHATLRLPGTTPLSRPSRKATEEGWHRLAKSLNYILRTRGQESPKGESRKTPAVRPHAVAGPRSTCAFV